MTGKRSPWTTETSPRTPPDDDCAVVTVDHALLTPLERGPLCDVRRPTRSAWMRGAVHDAEGALVPESQRPWGGDPFAPVAADPRRILPRKRRGAVEGTWLYGGHGHLHFGHYLLEGVTNLWPDPAEVECRGVLMHRNFRGPLPTVRQTWRPKVNQGRTHAWLEEMRRLAGYGDHEIAIARHGLIEVERLVVPERPVVLKGWARPEAVRVWRRMAAAVPPANEKRVFFSRRLFHQSAPENQVRSTPEWDQQMEKTFTKAGFTVVHPETLPITEQIGLARGARVIAGASGSALHLSAFSEPDTKVLTIGDNRSPDRPLLSQRMIDAAYGRLTAFVPDGDVKALDRALATI